jgi:Ca2+-dependent lipid-binding protein
VNVIKAEGLGDHDVFGGVDPFIEVEYDGKKRKTSKKKKEKNPVWEEILEFENTGLGRGPITVRLMDWDMVTANDFIGEAQLTNQLPTTVNNIVDANFNVVGKGSKETGRVWVKIEFSQK